MTTDQYEDGLASGFGAGTGIAVVMMYHIGDIVYIPALIIAITLIILNKALVAKIREWTKPSDKSYP